MTELIVLRKLQNVSKRIISRECVCVCVIIAEQFEYVYRY